jgi:WD40 repeat protein
LVILGLIACIIFVGVSIAPFFFFLPSEQVAQQSPIEKASTQVEGSVNRESTKEIESIRVLTETINDSNSLVSPTLELQPNISPSNSTVLEPGFIGNIVLSPDAKILAVNSNTGVRFYDMETFELISMLEDYRETATSVAWSSDGRQIALGDRDGTVRVWDTMTGGQLNIHEGFLLAVSIIAWSPKGNQIVIGYGDDKIWQVWDIVSGKEIEYGAQDILESAAWSPDGKQFVTANFDGTVRIWDAITRDQVHIIPAYQQVAMDVAWSPDGTQIVSGGYNGPMRLWDTATGKELYILQNQFLEAIDVDWSPDGQWIAAARWTYKESNDAVVRIWNLTNGENRPILENQIETAISLEWTPDGRQLIIGADGAIWLWDMDNNEGRRVITGYKKRVR